MNSNFTADILSSALFDSICKCEEASEGGRERVCAGLFLPLRRCRTCIITDSTESGVGSERAQHGEERNVCLRVQQMARRQYQQSVDLDTRVVNYSTVKFLGSARVDFKSLCVFFSFNVSSTNSQEAIWKNINSHFSKC